MFSVYCRYILMLQIDSLIRNNVLKIDRVRPNIYQTLEDHTRCPCYGHGLHWLWLLLLEPKTGGQSHSESHITKCHFRAEEVSMMPGTVMYSAKNSSGFFTCIQAQTLAYMTRIWYTRWHRLAFTFVIMQLEHGITVIRCWYIHWNVAQFYMTSTWKDETDM